jgi:hypothetical protein
MLVVEDAAQDARFADNPLVTGEPNIRFYAGRPLLTDDGSAVGTLCIIDRQPRRFTQTERAALEDLAQVAEAELRLIGIVQLQSGLDERQLELQRTLRLEEGMGRLRDQIISAIDHEALQQIIEQDLPRELLAFGIKVCSVSVQLPATRRGLFVDAQRALQDILVERNTVPIRRYSWVGEAWDQQQPIIVDGDRLRQAALPDELRSLVEIPLPGGGSMGTSSSKPDAFKEWALHLTRSFATLFNFRDYRELTEREFLSRQDLVEAHLHRTILEMNQVEDFARLVRVIGEQLESLDLAFEAVGVNVIDEESKALHSYTYVGDRIERQRNKLNTEYNQELVRHWRESQVWERAADLNVVELFEDYAPTVIIDTPYLQGTLVVSLQAKLGSSARLITLMSKICTLLSLGHRRLGDIEERQLAQSQMRIAATKPRQHPRPRVSFSRI